MGSVSSSLASRVASTPPPSPKKADILKKKDSPEFPIEGSAGDEDLKDTRKVTKTIHSLSLGLNLSYIDEFIAECGGNDLFYGLSIFDVNCLYIAPFLKESGGSICSLLRKQRHDSVGPASVFVSCSCKKQQRSVQYLQQITFLYRTNREIWIP